MPYFSGPLRFSRLSLSLCLTLMLFGVGLVLGPLPTADANSDATSVESNRIELRRPTVVVEPPRWVANERSVAFTAVARRSDREAQSIRDRGQFRIPIPPQWVDKIDPNSPIEIRYGWGGPQRQRALLRSDLKPAALELSGFVDLLDGLSVKLEARLRSEIQVLRVPHRALISPSGRDIEIWTLRHGVVASHRVLIVQTYLSEADVIFADTKRPDFENVVRAGHHKTSPGQGVIAQLQAQPNRPANSPSESSKEADDEN